MMVMTVVVCAERKLRVQSAASDGLRSSGEKTESANQQFADETYMSSADWLRHHGLAARRLGFYDVLAPVVFRHEDGVLDLRVAPPCTDDDLVDAVTRCLHTINQ